MNVYTHTHLSISTSMPTSIATSISTSIYICIYIGTYSTYVYICIIYIKGFSLELDITYSTWLFEQGPALLRGPSVHCRQQWNHRTTLLFTLFLGTQARVLTEWAISPAPCSCNTCIIVFQNRWSFFFTFFVCVHCFHFNSCQSTLLSQSVYSLFRSIS